MKTWAAQILLASAIVFATIWYCIPLERRLSASMAGADFPEFYQSLDDALASAKRWRLEKPEQFDQAGRTIRRVRLGVRVAVSLLAGMALVSFFRKACVRDA